MATDDARSAANWVDQVYREKSTELLAALTREFGAGNLEAVEDALQEAMLRALDAWAADGKPNNPGGWLFVAARRRVLDRLRNAQRRDGWADPDEGWESGNIRLDPLEDDVLKLIFVCCHPALGWKAQLALMLKSLCALGNAEIAGVLLSTPEAVKKTLSRAKRRIRELDIAFELPDSASIDERFDAVLRCIYMMFNEGYLSHGSDELTQQTLCEQAIHVVRILVDAPTIADRGKASALASLLYLQASRLPARVDEQGRLVRLADQDRTQWDRRMIAAGSHFLEASMLSARRSPYHLQAAIAACHTAAPSYEDTDWAAIRALYDQLLELSPSPVIALNRTVAVAMTDGYDRALQELDALDGNRQLASYYLLPALKADYQRRSGDRRGAQDNYRRALELVGDRTSRRFLVEQLEACAFDY